MIASLMESNALEAEDHTNLPDNRFVSYCFERYGLNRGVYNTIDDWFYRHGVTSITERREFIIIFLVSLQEGRATYGPLKFGKGVLTKRLLDFMAKYQL